MNIKQFVLLCCLVMFSCAASSDSKFVYKRTAPILDDEFTQLLKYSDDEILNLVTLLNRSFRIPENIKIISVDEEGPAYNAESNEIIMPDVFTIGIYQLFKEAQYVKTEEELIAVTMDVVLHTLYHEVGHALVYLLDLPITGKEEDAVDSLATILILTTYDEGDEIALSAADLFGLLDESIDKFDEVDFWDEHSLDAQRFYNTICLIYGSNPEQYQSVISDLEIAEDRAELCIEDYSREERAWFKLLDAHLKK